MAGFALVIGWTFLCFVAGHTARLADDGVLRERFSDWRARGRMRRAAPPDAAFRPYTEPRCTGCKHLAHRPGECYVGTAFGPCLCGTSR